MVDLERIIITRKVTYKLALLPTNMNRPEQTYLRDLKFEKDFQAGLKGLSLSTFYIVTCQFSLISKHFSIEKASAIKGKAFYKKKLHVALPSVKRSM